MELEKTLTIAAPVHRVWTLLLDPKVMAGCVPGMQSVEIVSDVEYLAEIKVKISFIAARFKVKTTILDARAPTYLRIEGTGEDSSVASSMKQTSELFLSDLGSGKTEMRIKARADVLGRLGSFGLGVMKTKADRMWDEFGANFAAVAERVNDGGLTESGATDVQPAAPVLPPAAVQVPNTVVPATTPPTKGRWWHRAPQPDTAAEQGCAAQRLPTDIYIELHRAGGVVKVLWPASVAPEAAQWLKDLR